MDYDLITTNAISNFVHDYEKGLFVPRTEADIQGYIFSACLQEFKLHNFELNIHLNYPNLILDNMKRKKIDIVVGDSIAVEIKFEADYPGVSKPVVFREEVISDLERLKSMKNKGMPHCHFVFIDEDGTHYRNLYKYTDVALNWMELNIKSRKRSYLLHIEF